MPRRRGLASCLLACLVGVAGWVCACADLSGLGGLSAGSAAPEGGQVAQGGGDEAVAAAVGSEDAPSGTGDPLGNAADVEANPETAALPDSAAERDAFIDAAAACRAQCGGCCDSAGTCHGGQSVATCGSGGGACRDCSPTGETCAASGACVAASPREAGPPPACVVTKCTNTCPTLPLLEAPCCKSDQTCGCGAVLGILLCN